MLVVELSSIAIFIGMSIDISMVCSVESILCDIGISDMFIISQDIITLADDWPIRLSINIMITMNFVEKYDFTIVLKHQLNRIS